MTDESIIPADIQRFLLTSIQSVPHLEAVLLLRRQREQVWDALTMAHSLYISEKEAEATLADLCSAGFATCWRDGRWLYRYGPVSEELKGTIDRLADLYPKHLIAMTKLIHAGINKQAQQFGDAFRLKDGKE